MKNYVRYSFGLTLLVVLMAIALRYIPDQIVQDSGLGRADILADLFRTHTEEECGGEDELDMELLAQRDGVEVVSSVSPDAEDTTRQVSVISVNVSESNGSDTTARSKPAETSGPAEQRPGKLTPIVDYSNGGYMLPRFIQKLGQVGGMDRPLRIGFLGDSFIEGDLLTADFRELMQNAYGGGGVGFVPITSQVAGFRQTVKHKFNNWKQSSIVNSKNGNFTISAYNYTPSEGGYVEYSGTQFKSNLSRFDQARLLYVSRGESTIRATANEVDEFVFYTEPSAVLQEILLEGDISDVRYTVNDVEGFTAYGVFLENSRGVSVDNFSVRGNSGIPMTRVNATLSEQFGKLAPYDMIVLQYGLNIVSSSQTNYSSYGEQMTAVVNHIKACFPNAAILVMSVGDRATRSEGQLVTMPGIKPMVKAQQEVAEACGVLFWNTYDMMRSLGGMPTFVKNGWAAKDYTHIGARGGEKIAKGLFDAIQAAR